jgi:hypothetical protein
MCLLVSQPASTVFTEDFLQGVYAYNSDGIGVMFANENGLNILRCVPKTEADFIKFFRENIEGRDCAWHARMRTHGDINLDNCHPYQVISADEGYPLYLAHNGVLATGNSKDTKKSDTWHYIQDYLRPMLLSNPQFFLTPAFEDMVSSHIGSGNKFILMDAFGNSVTINEQVGVIHEGAWLSNTYAWDTTGTRHERKAFKSSFRGYYNYSSDDAFPGLTSLVEQEKEVVEEDYTLIDEGIDFACELFEAAAEAGLDLVTWLGVLSRQFNRGRIRRKN